MIPVNESFNSKTLQTMPGASFVTDRNYIILSHSENFASFLNLETSELMGRNLTALDLPEIQIFQFDRPPYPSLASFYRDGFSSVALLEVGTGESARLFSLHQNWFDISSGSCNTENLLFGNMIEITARRSEYKTLYRANRILRSIRAMRKITMHADSEKSLYKDACSTIIQESGYLSAWIGLVSVENGSRIIRPVAAAGMSDNFIENFHINLDTDGFDSSSTVKQVMRKERPFVFHNLSFESAQIPSPQDYANKKSSCLASLPIQVFGDTIGVFHVYSVESDAFDEGELELLSRYTSEISSAVTTIRTGEQDRKTEGEKESLRDMMIRIQKMEAIGTMAGGIAHDFNNLLNIIKGYTQILLIKGTEFDNDLKEIDLAARKAADLTKQLLLLGRQPVRNSRGIDINSLIRKNVEMVSKLTEDRVEFRLNLNDSIHFATGNEGQIDQIIINLLINAMDSIEETGRIYVESSEREISFEEVALIPHSHPGKYIIVSVEDTGTGISPATMERIFDPFFTTKEPGKGTGMGLAVAQSIISAHRGWINVYSEEGKGTCFRVYMPSGNKEKGSVNTDGKKTIGIKKDHTGLILVIEDDPAILRMVSGFLEEKGFAILKAMSGKEALDIFSKRSSEIDLIFSDVVLPDQDGLTLSTMMKEQNPDSRFLFASGYTEARARYQDIRIQGYDFIQKPYDLLLLLQEIEKLIH